MLGSDDGQGAGAAAAPGALYYGAGGVGGTSELDALPTRARSVSATARVSTSTITPRFGANAPRRMSLMARRGSVTLPQTSATSSPMSTPLSLSNAFLVSSPSTPGSDGGGGLSGVGLGDGAPVAGTAADGSAAPAAAAAVPVAAVSGQSSPFVAPTLPSGQSSAQAPAQAVGGAVAPGWEHFPATPGHSAPTDTFSGVNPMLAAMLRSKAGVGAAAAAAPSAEATADAASAGTVESSGVAATTTTTGAAVATTAASGTGGAPASTPTPGTDQ